MIRDCVLALCFYVVLNNFCEGQFVKLKIYSNNETTMPPLPFPPCRADNIDCLRRGLRTFFFLMDSGYKGMTSVDPIIISSVAVSLPEQELSFLMRRVNVTGARWTRLAERKFHLVDDKNGVTFKSDLHITGEITIDTASRVDPIVATVTIDAPSHVFRLSLEEEGSLKDTTKSTDVRFSMNIEFNYWAEDVESNITYAWTNRQGIDNEDYILIDRERIAVRNTRAPTFFVQPNNEETLLIEQILNLKPSILEHFTNEITNTLMHTVMDNFRLFARKVPVKYYYEYIV